jgi:hypothetical protein
MDKLTAEGFVELGGPVGDGDGDDALLVIVAPDDETAISRLADDPWKKTGMLVVKSIQRRTIFLEAEVKAVISASRSDAMNQSSLTRRNTVRWITIRGLKATAKITPTLRVESATQDSCKQRANRETRRASGDALFQVQTASLNDV